MAQHLQTGEGWRLGWRPAAPEFRGLLGGNDWAVELTEAELDDFCRLATQLAETMQAMASELMDEENLTCELESDRIWIAGTGQPAAFELRFMLLTGRQAEGGWPAEVVPALLQAIPRLRGF